jgi:hypothetical protein
MFTDPVLSTLFSRFVETRLSVGTRPWLGGNVS